MKNEILKLILEDKEIVDILENANLNEECFVHFGLGRLIRNKFLWCRVEEALKLCKEYGAENIDDLSCCLISEAVEILKSNK